MIKKPRIAMIITVGLVNRNIMETDVFQYLAEQQSAQIAIVGNKPEYQAQIEAYPHLSFYDLNRPSENRTIHQSFAARVKRFLYRKCEGWLGSKADFSNLAYRFNEIHQFAGHRLKQNLSLDRQQIEHQAGNFLDAELGKPFPRSWLLFRWLYSFYYSSWQLNDPAVEAFYEEFQPDLVVMLHVQNPVMKPYLIAAQKRDIPILGLVASWDQPTTKGAIGTGMYRYMVQNQIMKEDLIQYHHIPEDQIDVTGWTQFDFYKKPNLIMPREDFLNSIGVPVENKLLVIATSNLRLGQHEPDIVAHIAKQIQQAQYGLPCTLYIRPHPRGDKLEELLRPYHHPPQVIYQERKAGELDFSANLLYHADVVFTTASSIGLDAVALDTPVIGVGFDGDLQREPYESIRIWYDTDHYSKVVASGGVRLVESYAAMDEAIRCYLQDPQTDAAAREALRQSHLEPFDGQSSKRFVDIMLREALRSTYPKPMGYPLWR